MELNAKTMPVSIIHILGNVLLYGYYMLKQRRGGARIRR